MLKAYFVPLKGDIGGHIMFLQTMYGRTDIFQSNYYWDDKPNPQNRIGMLNIDVDEEVITQWCYAHFKKCEKHPAVIKMNLETMQQELYYSDSYIEDFITKNYDEIIRKLNA